MFRSSFFPCLGIELSLQKILLNLNPQPGGEKYILGPVDEFLATGAGCALPVVRMGLQPGRGASSASLLRVNLTFIWRISKLMHLVSKHLVGGVE